MYQYDEFDHQMLKERTQQFRGQVERYLDGQIPEDEFKALRLRNGLYYQRHAHMLRVAIPKGCCHQLNCGSWWALPETMIGTTVISLPARISSTTGLN